MKTWFLIVFVFIHQFSQAQTISTYAVSVYDPNGIAFDAQGNLYVASPLGYVVYKIDTSGVVTTFAGTGSPGFSGDGGPATAATFNQPVCLAIDSLGNVLVTDALNNRIRKITVATGIITTVVGNDTAGFYGDGGLASAASLNSPSGAICFDNLGNFYIGDVGNYRVRKVNTSGIISTIVGNGIEGSTGDGGPATAAETYPTGMVFDNIGNMFISEYGELHSGCKVRKINTSGIISTYASDSAICTYNGDDIPATSAYIGASYLTEHNGMLYLSDGCNHRIRMIDASGIIHTVAGNGILGYSGDGGAADSAEFKQNTGIAFDQCGNLYIAQVDNPRIRKVSFNPACWPEKVPQVIKNEVSIYPNPAYEVINVDNVTAQEKYVIINITGIIEQSGALKAGNNTILVQALPTGLYLLQLTDNEGRKTMTKIIKQ